MLDPDDLRRLPTSRLVAEGASRAPATVAPSRFCRDNGVASEYEYKRQCMQERRISYHMHVGLNTWPATRSALGRIVEELGRRGHEVHRFGLCLDRGMSVPPAERDAVPKETGPRLAAGEWREVAETVPVQPHLGDFMIGTAAGLENTLAALSCGVTTVGNLGQYFTFDTPGRSDDVTLTQSTLRALGAMAAMRPHGGLVHSYLDDGPGTALSSYAGYLGWAALERYVVEDLVGARLAPSFGGLVPQPRARILVALALHRLYDGDLVGSMVYGNTVDYTRDHLRNVTVLTRYLTADIATQLHRPTGHAVHPLPLTENERIPSAEEIVEVQLLGRAIEQDVRGSAGLFDWAELEQAAGELVEYAGEFRTKALAALAADGVDVRDAGALLLSLRRLGAQALEDRLDLPTPPEASTLVPWKTGLVSVLVDRLSASGARLTGLRLVVATVDTHDVVRDALLTALPSLGAFVIPLAPNATAGSIVHAAAAEDADAVIAATYNGAALSVATEMLEACRHTGYRGLVVLGGQLNQDVGEDLPVEVRGELTELGIRCIGDLDELVPALAAIPR